MALGGLFTSHITGNLVILATHYAIGCFGEIGPLLSVPVFVAVLGAVTLASVEADKAGYRPARARSRLKAALMSARWVNACGKFPRASPLGPVCSAYSPRWLP